MCDEQWSVFGNVVSAVHKGLISPRNNYQVGLMVNGALLASRWVAGLNLSGVRF